jgi:hypothetical protein
MADSRLADKIEFSKAPTARSGLVERSFWASRVVENACLTNLVSLMRVHGCHDHVHVFDCGNQEAQDAMDFRLAESDEMVVVAKCAEKSVELKLRPGPVTCHSLVLVASALSLALAGRSLSTFQITLSPLSLVVVTIWQLICLLNLSRGPTALIRAPHKVLADKKLSYRPVLLRLAKRVSVAAGSRCRP